MVRNRENISAHCQGQHLFQRMCFFSQLLFRPVPPKALLAVLSVYIPTIIGEIVTRLHDYALCDINHGHYGMDQRNAYAATGLAATSLNARSGRPVCPRDL